MHSPPETTPVTLTIYYFGYCFTTPVSGQPRAMEGQSGAGLWDDLSVSNDKSLLLRL